MMSTRAPMLRLLPLLAPLLWWTGGPLQADDRGSGFGQISIPAPAKPAAAERCVEPVEVMRRDHMTFLDHQRDRTVIDGERGSRYSLVGCIDCHNPADSGEVIRYQDPRHFCADCHRYASVTIDCFECHADRGLSSSRRSALDSSASQAPAWYGAGQVTAATLQTRLGGGDDD